MTDAASTLVKRPRGRPPGSGGCDDSKALSDVADLLIAEPQLRPSTAMKRVVPRIQASHLRRLQDKWKRGADQFRLEASARKKACEDRDAARAARSASAVGLAYGYGRSAFAELHATAAAFSESSVMRGVREAVESTTMRRMMEMAESPTMRALRDLSVASAPFMAVASAYDRLREQHEQIERIMRPHMEMQRILDRQREMERALSPYGNLPGYFRW